MLFWRFVARLSVALVGLLSACVVQSQMLDLGAHADQVRERLGPADKNWVAPTCPGYRIELRHQGALWLKLIYAPNARLAAAGIFRLRQPAPGRKEALRWPGLKPGFAAGDAYPPMRGWNPVLFNMGAKQWQWFEQAEAPPAGREELLGSVVVDVASGFAGGRDFPFDMAQTALGLRGVDLQASRLNRPLLAWRQRTRPNAFVQALMPPALREDCSPSSMAMLDYTDILPARF